MIVELAQGEQDVPVSPDVVATLLGGAYRCGENECTLQTGEELAAPHGANPWAYTSGCPVGVPANSADRQARPESVRDSVWAAVKASVGSNTGLRPGK